MSKLLTILGAALLVGAAPVFFGWPSLAATQSPAKKSSASGQKPPARSSAPASTTKTPAKSSPAEKPSTSTKKKITRKSRKPRGQAAPAPERIKEIQAALVREGFYGREPNGSAALTINGKWDAASVAAMRQFQQARGLNPTGKMDARTLQLLGLGSEIAGVAPPLPQAKDSASNGSPPR